MKIKLVQPVPLNESERNRRQREYDALLHGVIERETRVQVAGIDRGPSSIVHSTDQLLSDVYVLKEGSRADEEGFNAIVVDCIFDPSVDALREMLNIPVIGPFQNAVALATTLGPRLSILCLDEVQARVLTRRAYESGVHPWELAPTRTLGVEIDDTHERKKKKRDGTRAWTKSHFRGWCQHFGLGPHPVSVLVKMNDGVIHRTYSDLLRGAREAAVGN